MSLETTARHRTTAELEALAAELTTEEKVALVVGAGLWTTTAIDRIGLRPVVMSDGPAGVRGTGDVPGETSASFPAPSAVAATWDRALVARAGALVAAEARRHGVDMVLAPQINLQRTPVGGRHFECYSEDPLLTGEIAHALVGEVQEHGVAMCIKHYVANDSETERTRYLARVDERTLREVYLAPFELLVDKTQAWSAMAAYSGIDDGRVAATATEHAPLVQDVLKREWGFDGVVVSDWLATKTVAGAVRGGLDLQMPGPDGPWGDGLLAAVRSGEVAESEIDDKVVRILRLAERVGALGADGVTPPAPERPAVRPDASALLRELAARSVVMLKDDEQLVPLDLEALAAEARTPRVALLGPAAVDPFVQGGGSGFVNPDHLVLPVPAILEALGDGVRVDVHHGARARVNPPEIDVAERCTDPETGAPGVRVELLDAGGAVLASTVDAGWSGWYPLVEDPRAMALRLVADVRLDEPGEHELGVGTVGRHEIRVDGALVASSDHVVAEEIVLSSGHNHPTATTTVVTVDEPRTVRLDARLQVVHPVGYDSFVRGEVVHRLPGPSAEADLAAAVGLAADADVAIVVVGTTEEVESEGYDRPDLDLPGNQDELVRRVLAANPRTIVVVNAGAPVVLPWLEQAGTVLWSWLAGQECGGALSDVLTGVTEPSGRLPWTLPARYQDVPVPSAIPQDGVVSYDEGVHVGYRQWERDGLEPAAPFGHGLGWTTWEHRSADVASRGNDGADGIDLDVEVANVGPRDGREVVQVYVEPPAGGGHDRPVRWLGGFEVVAVDAGESATVRVHVPRRAFEVWDVAAHRWSLPAGDYRLRVGRSVRDLRLDVTVPLGEPLGPPDGPAVAPESLTAGAAPAG
ncbi:beta-glucosidase family protein [Luteimicrobium subarcticum]|uniref:Beta-glucosidase n=1 Tax=Luteimicrobium subarcticum TaxID=620910 RepID=A0A2M8WSU1_9MICO|nr:glycoside hydrolase family 3 C-terminal domain-containing protein [Luteimicrobium subarcticum]PJI93896.1 beta-glucosidase [Luteimicrobium subarcticum]